MIEVYVCHIGTSILFMGQREACQQYRDNQAFPTDCWRVSSLESYGDACYSDGYDNGYDSGYDEGTG